MAKPITSFKINDKGLRFFYLHNTLFELPHTIPMDIVSFINFNRSNLDEFLHVFHDVYPDLIYKGTTLNECSYELLNSDIKQHTEHLADIIECNASKHLLNTADQICKLFESQRNFSSFKKKFDELFKNISPHLPRPFEYYESWNSTANALFKINLKEHDYLQKLMTAEYDKHGVTIVPDFLLELINSNRIPLNSIPHVYRHHSKIEEVFRRYAAADLLPQTQCAEIKISEEFAWKSFPMAGALLRRFTELCLHSDYGIADSIRIKLKEIQQPIHELNDEQLLELNDFSYVGASLINLSSGEGLNKLTWKFTKIEKSPELFFIAEYHDNALILYDANIGLEMNNEIYHDILRTNGSLFEANTSGLYYDNHIWRFNKVTQKVEYVQKSANTSNFIESYPTGFVLIDGGDKYYYNSGWFNNKNEPLSPLCFTSSGPFTEGLAPVCLNGKWGFIDELFNLVIPAIYGHVQTFQSGYSKVFLLDKEFSGEQGEWVELPISEDLGEKFVMHKTSGQLLRQFKGYPKKVKLPVRVLCDKAWQKNRIDFNYFGSRDGEGLDRRLGRYILIDKAGKIVFRNTDRFTFDLTPEGEIVYKDKEVIESEDKFTHPLKRKVSSRKHALIDKEVDEYRNKLQKHECGVYDIPDELLANATFIFDVFSKGFINYSDLPLHYKLDRNFVIVELNRNIKCEQILPASIKEKHLSAYRAIAKKQRINAFVENIKECVLVGKHWPERICYLELFTGIEFDMYHYTLQALKPLLVGEILNEIGKAFMHLRETNQLFQDLNPTCENVYKRIIESEMFIVPEFTTCNVIKSLTNTGISVLGYSQGVFKLQITHELYQDEYEHTIFHQATAQVNFIESCEEFIANTPPIAEEHVFTFNDRIKKFLEQLGFKEQALLQVPIYKQTTLPILEPFDQLPLAPSLPLEERCSKINEDDLPF
jgi:hypothetical protein